MKKEKQHKLSLVILTVLLILSALVAEAIYFSNFEYRIMTRRFTRILHEREKIMENCLGRLKPLLAGGELHGSVSEKNILENATRNEITILEYIDKKLIHWSDNDFDVPLIMDDSLFLKPLVFIQNGWFVPGLVESGNESIAGFLRVRTDYSFENDIVKSGFSKNFRLPAETELSTQISESGYNIFNTKGTFLFSLVFPKVKSNTPLIFFPLILWTLALLFMILLSLQIVKILNAKEKNVEGLFISFLFYAALYLAVLFLKRPQVFFRTDLFSPYIFSLNSFIPSMGHLLLLSILVAVLAYSFYEYFNSPVLRRKGKTAEDTGIYFLLPGSAVLLCLSHHLFSQLVSDSNINFETYKVLKLSYLSVAGFFTVFLMLIVPFFLMLKIFREFKEIKFKSMILPVLLSLVIIVLFSYQDIISLITIAFFFLVLIFVARLIYKGKTNIFSDSIIFSLAVALYSLIVISVNSEKKITENIKVQAISFSTDNDPEAEHLLLDIWPEIKGDTILEEMMNVASFSQTDFYRISDYLRETYFGGYWVNYNYNIVLCREDQLLRISSGEEDSENCFSFFDYRTNKYGHQLTGTGFYFIDNLGGRSYYLGKIYYSGSSESVNGLFIELYSDIDVFQPGYSELLLDKKFHGYAGLKDYSFAKYINGTLVLNSGEYPYNNSDDAYIDESSEYRIFSKERFRHVVYRNGNRTVIISRPEINTGDILISMAYLFAFILIISNLLVMLIRKPQVKNSLNLNFRQKLQMSFIGILLFSFILIGIVVVSLTAGEFKAKHYENIKDKLNSIYIELEANLGSEDQLTSDWRNNTSESLNALLINLSNTFNTDINIFDLNGFLMATSRPEIFYRNLTSQRMNIVAFINIKDLTRSEYFQTERLGNMKYISGYVPYYNSDNKVLAYVNLPYFRMQSLLAKEISNLIVAVINFTLLLILITMGLAVFISGRLTSPLSMLSEGLASVKLGRKSEHLSYSGNDEIGDMVKQYNIMVDELEESSHRLASSEREYAWREMAKQIAHEIKNPLTPMKLNVQQLLKSWRDGNSNFEERLKGFAKNQIEYIDNLSLIASAFSSFAKMPGANPVEMNLLEQIKTTLELFRNTDNVTFWVRWPHESKVFIYADKEQINGILSNLIKNSIQAIPQDRKGLIKVTLEVVRDKVLISVADNGTGIPETLQDKMFTPNFTTKTSGTGLGLSIVKKYVEAANGRIWFKSDADNGTTFYVEFPLKYTVEKPGEPHED
ncbi:MAG: GHKL domain-containing protein [Bacteroidales bacterium]|nr:GHKL domain-containing protein [Bacteroidales bacterium]